MRTALDKLIEFSSAAVDGALRGAGPAPQTRAEIRRGMARALGEEEWADLGSRPRYARWSTSISHSGALGAWVAAERPARIGLDVEEYARLGRPVIERIAVASEIEAAPDPRFLWCAKEAAFKAGGRPAPTVLSSIRVGGWRALARTSNGTVGAYSYRSDRGGRGWLTRDGSIILAVYLDPN